MRYAKTDEIIMVHFVRRIETIIIYGILSISLMIPASYAQEGGISAHSQGYMGLGVSLFLLSDMREIDKMAERMADRATERSIRRAARRAEDQMEDKASRKAEEMAVDRQIKRGMKAKENAKFMANKKKLQEKRIGINRHREFQELYNDNGFEAIGDELLILVNKESSVDMESKGYRVKDRKYLEGLDLVLLRIEPPKGKNLSESADYMEKNLKDGEVSLNHLFVPEFGASGPIDTTYSMMDISEKLNLPSVHSQRTGMDNAEEVKLGLIDTLVDHSHAALQGETIKIEDFVPYDKERPKVHGTAVASIMVGNEPSVYQGVVPGAKLFAASVFFKQGDKGVAATTESLLYALDWLVQEEVKVINMSLSGPANSLLEIAVKKILAKGVLIIAAVGNAGPTSQVLYPAAYDGVIAVTAVDKEQHVYWRANRGRHVMFAAPGVNIPTAHAGGGYDVTTGTSIAAPFVSAILATTENKNSFLNHNNIVGFLEKHAIDLGTKGFDTTYGYGLIQAVPN